jgi:hypothetical protein
MNVKYYFNIIHTRFIRTKRRNCVICVVSLSNIVVVFSNYKFFNTFIIDDIRRRIYIMENIPDQMCKYLHIGLLIFWEHLLHVQLNSIFYVL